MLLADDHLQPGIGQQGRGGQAADAGADDRHVAGLVGIPALKRRAGKIRRRPIVALVALSHRRQGAPHQSFGNTTDATPPATTGSQCASTGKPTKPAIAIQPNNTAHIAEIFMLMDVNSGVDAAP